MPATATVSEPAATRIPPAAWRPPVLLGAVLTLLYGVLLRLDLSVPQPTDHSRYMDAARSFPSAPQNPIFDHQYLRIGLTAPTAVVMKVFGYSEVTYHAFPMATALLLFASVYAIGVLWFGRLVGALSAAVLGCVGVIVVGGTELLPDLPATALFTAAVALTIAVREGLLPWRRIWLVVMGVLMGWSYLTREFIVFVWPLVPVLLWRRVGRWEWLWGFVPVALTGIGETALNAHLYGDPLARLHAGSGLGDLPSRPAVAATFHDLPLWVYLWRLPQQLARLAEGPGMLLLLALTLAAGVFVVVRRVRGTATIPERRVGVFALWVMLLWVPLTLEGGVLNPAHPKLRLQLLRYWYPAVPGVRARRRGRAVAGGPRPAAARPAARHRGLGGRLVRRGRHRRRSPWSAGPACRAGRARTGSGRTRCRSSARGCRTRTPVRSGWTRGCSASCRSTSSPRRAIGSGTAACARCSTRASRPPATTWWPTASAATPARAAATPHAPSCPPSRRHGARS